MSKRPGSRLMRSLIAKLSLRDRLSRLLLHSGLTSVARLLFRHQGASYSPGGWRSSPNSSLCIHCATTSEYAGRIVKALQHRCNRVLLNPTGSTTAALEFDFSALDSDIPLECRLFCILDRGLHDLSAAGIRKLASGRAKVLYFRLNDPSESPDEIAYNLQSFDLRRDFSAAQQDAFVASRIEEALELLLQRYDPALASVATLPESAAIVRPALLATAPLPPAAALTFVIPTLNGGAEFESTLRSIRAQRIYAASPLLVVDSGSTDGTVELAKKYGAVVHSIHSTQFNHGATRDFIIGKTTTPLVALLVQDATLMDSETMVNMVRHMQRERVAGVYTAPLPVAEHDEFAARESLLHRAYLGPYAKTYSMPSRELYERLDFAQRLQMSRFDNICSLLRRSVWAHIPFGHTTFGEDISWSKHVQAQGYHVIYDPFARVFHSHMRPPEYTRKRYATETFHVAAMLATFPVDYSDVGIDEMDRLSDAIEGDSAAFIARARALSLRHRLTVRNVRNALATLHMEIHYARDATQRDWRATRCHLLALLGEMLYDKEPTCVLSLIHLESLASKATAATIGHVWGLYLASYAQVHEQLTAQLQQRLDAASRGV